MQTHEAATQKYIHILNIPLRSGSMMPGTENDGANYREAGLAAALSTAGCTVVDEGDLQIPNYLPHHTVPPIRNWPGPRIVWDLISDRIDPWLRQPGHLPFLIGCDCSVAVGTSQALSRSLGNVHVLYIDGDYDDSPPNPGECQSAAATVLWLLTHPSVFLSGPPLTPDQVTVVGWSKPSRCDSQIRSVSLAEIKHKGASRVVREILAAIPDSTNILVHFDIDVIADHELPVAYFPHSNGLSMEQASDVLGPVLRDPRIRVVEVSEYSSLRDLDRRWVRKLIRTLGQAFGGYSVPAADR